jgi:hypothetical protein
MGAPLAHGVPGHLQGLRDAGARCAAGQEGDGYLLLRGGSVPSVVSGGVGVYRARGVTFSVAPHHRD